MKRRSLSYIVRELHIKITSNHYAKLRSTDSTTGWPGCGAKGALALRWPECKLWQRPWKGAGRFLTKLNIFFHSIQQSHFLLFARKSRKLRSTATRAHVYSSFIHHCPNVEGTPCLASKWINGVNPHNGMLFSVKKKWAIKPRKATEEPNVHLTEWKKTTYCGIPTTIYDILEKATLGTQ